MLLVTSDHLNKRDDLDFFEASMAAPEIGMLGTRLDEIANLGPEAQQKLASLPFLDDDRVASTVHELLVGAALVDRGRQVEMLPENRATKVPDFAIHGFGVPIEVECKRRLGLSTYELHEAVHVERLYAAVRPVLEDRGLHVLLGARFTSEVASVTEQEFSSTVLSLLSDRELDGAERLATWGAVTCRVLPYASDVTTARLYSPVYLKEVFGWSTPQADWDGLLCEVDPPRRVVVGRCRNPRGLAWVSASDAALTKKARGVTSLWRRAAAQIRPAAMGLIYLAYPEGNRAAVADARTAHIRDAPRGWIPRWTVHIPLTVIARLYPRALGVGVPDLIESAMPVTVEADGYYARMFPANVFTFRPDESGRTPGTNRALQRSQYLERFCDLEPPGLE
jgi:hypothetical protein